MWNSERYERRSSGGGGGGGGGGIISRLFGSKRRSLPALEELDEKQLAEDLRRHVWAVAIAGNENPMPYYVCPGRSFLRELAGCNLHFVPQTWCPTAIGIGESGP
ncbi:unnamed protein product [Clonostachys solani]|uniref:Uncharacterized protein n=1 Tax=Clonostachys solani TaxID=160281 RepID=A0A9P0EIG1_9HYPO|nr:unnamed protein product [Clonostachys solani]